MLARGPSNRRNDEQIYQHEQPKCDCVAAHGNRIVSRGGGPQTGDLGDHVLSLASIVRSARWCEATGLEVFGRGESETEAIGP